MPFPLPGAGAAPSTPAVLDVLGVRATVPPTTGFSVGDVISVAGEVLMLVDDDTDANVLRGTAAAGSDDYRGVNQVTGGANNYGSFADPAYEGEVSWYTVGGGGSPSWRVRLPDAALPGSPPATIYARCVGDDGQTTDIELDRDAARDSTSLTAYASGDDDPRAEIPVGMGWTLTVWSDAWDGTALDVHDVERWEKYHLVAGPDVPPTLAQIYHLVKAVLRAGSGASVTPDDAADTLTVAAAAGIAASKVQTVAAANVVIDTPAMDAWSAWTTVVTTAAATAAGVALVKAQLHGTLTATPSPPAASLVALTGGGDRVHSEYRVVRVRGGGDTVIEGVALYQPRNMANASGATYIAATRGSDASISWDDECQVGDVYRVEARHIAQGGAASPPAQRRLTYTAAEQMISVVTLASAGAGQGQGQQSDGAGDGFSRGAAAPASPAEGAVWSDTTSDAVRRYTGTAWEDLATEDYVDAGDAVLLAALDGALTGAVRRATWARAWIRAADQAAALAGVAAATWSNQGSGTAPTGAHWSLADVPAGAGDVWELTALVSPTPGSAHAWTFGTWSAYRITSTNTQYSVDGSAAWHAVRAGADRYERHRIAGGAWGPAIPLYAADELTWTTLLSREIYHATTRWMPGGAGILTELPATVEARDLQLLRVRLQTQSVATRVPILDGSAYLDPAILIADTYASRVTATPPQSHLTYGLRLDGRGLTAVGGKVPMGRGGDSDGTDAGLEITLHQPDGLSTATTVRYVRVVYLRTLVRHILTLEAI